jgi:1,4-dihydroxy-2-naphthoyl-CoA hydrolase
MPFALQLGITVQSAHAEEAVGRLAWRPELCTVDGVLHGGVLMALADSVGAICAYLNLPEGAGTATVNSTTTLFRAVRSGTVRAVSRPLHAGRSFVTVQTDLSDEEGRPVSQTTQTQAVLRR